MIPGAFDFLWKCCLLQTVIKGKASQIHLCEGFSTGPILQEALRKSHLTALPSYSTNIELKGETECLRRSWVDKDNMVPTADFYSIMEKNKIMFCGKI